MSNYSNLIALSLLAIPVLLGTLAIDRAVLSWTGWTESGSRLLVILGSFVATSTAIFGSFGVYNAWQVRQWCKIKRESKNKAAEPTILLHRHVTLPDDDTISRYDGPDPCYVHQMKENIKSGVMG